MTDLFTLSVKVRVSVSGPFDILTLCVSSNCIQPIFVRYKNSDGNCEHRPSKNNAISTTTGQTEGFLPEEALNTGFARISTMQQVFFLDV